jgi:hypothetical protein
MIELLAVRRLKRTRGWLSEMPQRKECDPELNTAPDVATPAASRRFICG